MLYGKKIKVRSGAGFTLYYAVLISAVLITVGASMANLALKEFTLSAAVRESEYAFYAADSGTECALYWDLNETNIFPSYLDTGNAPRVYIGLPLNPGNDLNPTPSLGSIRCDNNIAPLISPDYGAFGDAAPYALSSHATTTLTYNVGVNEHFCVKVSIAKYVRPDLSLSTYIDAHGYNLPCNMNAGGALPQSSRLVERAYITQYPLLYE